MVPVRSAGVSGALHPLQVRCMPAVVRQAQLADLEIDFTQGASVRGAELLFWAAAVQTFGGIANPDSRVEFEEFWSTIVHSANGLAGRVRRSIDRFSKGTAKRILEAAGIYDADTEKAREEARERLRWLWGQLGL